MDFIVEGGRGWGDGSGMKKEDRPRIDLDSSVMYILRDEQTKDRRVM